MACTTQLSSMSLSHPTGKVLMAGAGVHERKRKRTHSFKLLLTSVVLLSHWSKQVTWPGIDASNEGNTGGIMNAAQLSQFHYYLNPSITLKAFKIKCSVETYPMTIHVQKETFYKELNHMVTEAEKSQELQVGSWRPRTANGVVSVRRPAGSRPRKSQSFSSNPKAGKN